jgi:tetratricopeptide (TPR) repeat protein
MAEEVQSQITIESVKALRDRELKLYRTACEAAEKQNYKYAIDLFRDLLRRRPGLLEVRAKLREVQLGKIGGKGKPFRQMMAYFAVLPQVAKAQTLISGKHYAKALDNAEVAMSFDPTAIISCELMAKAAEAADCYEIFIPTLEWALLHHPRNIHLLDWLGRTFVMLKKGKKAVSCYGRIVEIEPNKMVWKERLKDATAVAAMEDGWDDVADGKGDYTSMIKDKEEAAVLEQSERVNKTQVGLAKTIEAQLQKVEAQESMDSRRKLAELYVEGREWDKALENYQRVIELSGVKDPVVERAMVEIELARYKERIAEWETYLATEGLDDAAKAEGTSNVAALKAERRVYLLQSLRDRVKNMPTAYDDRLELGLMLFEDGAVDEALNHFQFMQRSPRFVNEGALYSGKCFVAKKVYDLAIEQFRKVIDSVPNMTDIKKDAYYSLGDCYQQMGQGKEAVLCFKAIYGVDMNYRDVKAIVESPTG